MDRARLRGICSIRQDLREVGVEQTRGQLEKRSRAKQSFPVAHADESGLAFIDGTRSAPHLGGDERPGPLRSTSSRERSSIGRSSLRRGACTQRPGDARRRFPQRSWGPAWRSACPGRRSSLFNVGGDERPGPTSSSVISNWTETASAASGHARSMQPRGPARQRVPHAPRARPRGVRARASRVGASTSVPARAGPIGSAAELHAPVVVPGRDGAARLSDTMSHSAAGPGLGMCLLIGPCTRRTRGPVNNARPLSPAADASQMIAWPAAGTAAPPRHRYSLGFVA